MMIHTHIRFFWQRSGFRSCHGSVQSLVSRGQRDSLKSLHLPDLPPKESVRYRADSSASNGYQRPGSV